ncbi:ABC transporter permease [uncultured Piscinibacter sp.]|uniref:ABC transporter permease n=1 Tax=uncultured Piscinibacter sp. TaxID=1131835 RepID=UPI0026251BA3|nr:ABC transporter permease [uncultured Piscinibacter sp.]
MKRWPAWTVFAKEWVDALRDRRTLMVVLLSSVLMGPLVLVALSALVASFESRAERREVVLAGAEHAPTLVNYIARQGFAVKHAPADYETQLRRAEFGDPVLVLPQDFEVALQRAEVPLLVLVSDSANKRAEAGAGRLQGLVAGFNRERATLALALRGVSGELLEPVRLDERDLASPQTRGTQITGMLPFFVLMAVLYGALNAALDSTAGERERGSLEPLLMNPASPLAVVLGKWAAVSAVALLIAVLSCFSFIPAQWLLRSDTLAALFQFGWVEAAWFVTIIAPFAAALSALLMAVAIRCKSVKEAQASSAVVVLGVSLMPLVGLLNPGGEEPWHFWVPALAQNTLMTRVLKGDALGAEPLLASLAVCALLALLGVGFVARVLRRAAVR